MGILNTKFHNGFSLHWVFRVGMVIFLALGLTAKVAESTQDQKLSLKLNQHTIKISLPLGWKNTTELFGAEITLMGPWVKESRPAVSITDLNLTDQDLKLTDMEVQAKDYEGKKKQWVEDKKGTLTKVFPAEKLTGGSSQSGFHFGAEYILGSISYREHSYYYLCDHRWYQLKTLVRESIEPRFAKVMNSLAHSFSCQ